MKDKSRIHDSNSQKTKNLIFACNWEQFDHLSRWKAYQKAKDILLTIAIDSIVLPTAGVKTCPFTRSPRITEFIIATRCLQIACMIATTQQHMQAVSVISCNAVISMWRLAVLSTSVLLMVNPNRYEYDSNHEYTWHYCIFFSPFSFHYIHVLVYCMYEFYIK